MSAQQSLAWREGLGYVWVFMAAASCAADGPILIVPSCAIPLHVSTPLPDSLALSSETSWRLVELGGSGVAISADGIPALTADGLPDKDRRRLVAAIPPRVTLNKTRRFRLEPLAPAEVRSAFRLASLDEKSLGLWERDRPVFVYNHGVMSREGVPPDRNRSSYVHPVYGLDGEVLTDDFPEDHYHHRGLFWAWPHVRIAGEKVDLWLISGIRHVFERWLIRRTGSAAAVLAVENGWYVGDRKVVQERVWLIVHPATETGRAIDVELTWIATDRAVTLRGAEGKSYGGFSLRFAPRTDTVITTSTGRQSGDLNLARLEWADLSARFAGAPKHSGATIFVAPAHPGYPPMWITRFYGFLGVGWPGPLLVTLAPNAPVRCRYRVWIHRGSPDVTALKRAYEAYKLRDSATWDISARSHVK